MTQNEQVYELAKRRGGVNQDELVALLGWTKRQAANVLLNVERKTKLKVVVERLPTREKRMFVCAEDAKAWRAAHPRHHTASSLQGVRRSRKQQLKPLPADRPVQRQVAPDARGYQGFDPRYQLPPGAKPYGAGFAAVGIGRDVTTGKPWQADRQGAHE